MVKKTKSKEVVQEKQQKTLEEFSLKNKIKEITSKILLKLPTKKN